MAITGAITTAVGVGAGLYFGVKGEQAARDGVRRQRVAQQNAAAAAAAEQQRSEEAVAAANRRKVNTDSILANEGISAASTMLTGPMGLRGGAQRIGEKTLLGD